MTVIVWLLLCVPFNGGGGHFCILTCGCDRASFLCGCGSLCESVMVHVCICPCVAMWLWSWIAPYLP